MVVVALFEMVDDIFFSSPINNLEAFKLGHDSIFAHHAWMKNTPEDESPGQSMALHDGKKVAQNSKPEVRKLKWRASTLLIPVGTHIMA